MCAHANCVPTCSHLITALNMPQDALIARGCLRRMWIGWEQLEQSEAAVDEHQRQRSFRALSAALSVHVPCRTAVEKRYYGLCLRREAWHTASRHMWVIAAFCSMLYYSSYTDRLWWSHQNSHSLLCVLPATPSHGCERLWPRALPSACL